MTRPGWPVVLAAAMASSLVTWLLMRGDGDPSSGSASADAEQVAKLERENRSLSQEIARLEAARERAKTPRPRRAEEPPAPTEPPVAADPARVAIGEIALAARIPAQMVELSVEKLVELLREAVAKSDEAAAENYRRGLMVSGAAAVDPMMAILRDGTASVALRRSAFTVLGALDVPGLANLAGTLVASGQDTEPLHRAALRAAVTADPQGAVPVVQRLLWSSLESDRELALDALSHADDPVFAPMLREQIGRSDAARHRPRLVNAISRTKGRAWSAAQLTGEPDTPAAGDYGTAWASKGEDMGEVWLELDYADAVQPEAVRVHETFNPGAVVRIEARSAAGAWQVLWEGTPDAGAAPRWFEPALQSFAGTTNSLRLILDINRVRGWNEIDAVELAGSGSRQWATAARSSSSYAD